MLGVGKVIWYEELKRLDISKAISLGMTSPVVSLAMLALFFHEYPRVSHFASVGGNYGYGGRGCRINQEELCPSRAHEVFPICAIVVVLVLFVWYSGSNALAALL